MLLTAKEEDKVGVYHPGAYCFAFFNPSMKLHPFDIQANRLSFELRELMVQTLDLYHPIDDVIHHSSPS